MTKDSKTPKMAKRYAAPKLVIYGDVAKITASGSAGDTEGQSNSMQKMS